MAWSDDVDRNATGDGEDEDSEVFGRPGILDLAAQIRRDLLAMHLSEAGAGGGGVDETSDGQDGGKGGIGGGAVGGSATVSTSATTPAEPEGDFGKWVVRTEETRQLLKDLENNLNTATSRAEVYRRELSGYMDELQTRTFVTGDESETVAGSTDVDGEKELLVSLPADFDDVVDLNAHRVARGREQQQQQQQQQQKSRKQELLEQEEQSDDAEEPQQPSPAPSPSAAARGSGGAAGRGGRGGGVGRGRAAAGRGGPWLGDSAGGAGGRASGSTGKSLASGSRARGAASAAQSSEEDKFKLPDFLDKYFSDEKAIQQLPHKALQHEEEVKLGGPADENSLMKGFRQIARLDSLLTSREAAATARLKAAEVEMESEKERLRREAEAIDRQKMQVLQRMKERGLIRSSATSNRASAAPSEPGSALCSARGGGGSSTALAVKPGADKTLQVAIASNSAHTQAVVLAPDSPWELADWSGWTSSALQAPAAPAAAEDGAGGDGAGLSLAVAPPFDAGGHAAEAARMREEGDDVDDADTSTFNLTSATAAAPTGTSKPSTSSFASIYGRGRTEGSSVSSTLAVVPEAGPLAGGGGGPGGGGDGEGASGELMDIEDEEEEEGEELVYGADDDALEALRKIDEKLQNLVPESEWEAKSIYSLPTGSAAGDGPGGRARSRVRSVWSARTGGTALTNGESLPGDPALREQAEQRDAAQALALVDEKLLDLQALPAPEVAAPALSPEAIRSLLMHAAQDSAVPDTADKVLALTSGPAALAAALAAFEEGAGAAGAIVPAEPMLPEEAPLRRAKEILAQLAAAAQRSDEDGGDFGDDFAAAAEAERVLRQVEEEVRQLEATAAQRTEADFEAPMPDTGLAPLAERLHSIGGEVDALLSKGGLDPSILERVRALASGAALDGDESATVDGAVGESSGSKDSGKDGVNLSGGTRLPTLGAVGAGDLSDDDDDDLLSVISGSNGRGGDSDGGDGADAGGGGAEKGGGGGGGTDNPSADLLRALDIELPQGGSNWDDAELLRVLRAMDAHYGDQPPTVDPAADAADDGDDV